MALTWSYSSLELFKQCPYKYYRLRVKKDIVEPESEAMRYGTEVHKAAEDFIKDGTPVPEKYGFMVPMLEPIKAIKGRHLCEHKLGLTKDLDPCGFFDTNVWWRGIPDFLSLDGKDARLIDYKTGKSAKYANVKQLDLLALAIYKHFPEVENIKAGLLFVVAGDFIKSKYEKETHEKTWVQWLEETDRLEATYKADVWNAKPNFSCRGWCPVKDCIHNGKGR